MGTLFSGANIEPPTVTPPTETMVGHKILWCDKPLRIGKHFWCVVAYIGHGHGGDYAYTGYFWLREHETWWAAAREWPRFDGNDTYDGLPKSLAKTNWKHAGDVVADWNRNNGATERERAWRESFLNAVGSPA